MSGLSISGDDGWIYGDLNEDRLQRSKLVVWIVAGGLALFLVWAYFAQLDEVSTGSGRVVPTTREQTIQSLEGGILARVLVKQNDIVEPGQVLAQLDPTRSASDVEESSARYRAALARAARLEAEVSQTQLRFPAELADFPDLKAEETRLYNTRRQSLAQSLALVDRSLGLIGEEVRIARSLVEVGAASNVEVLRLQRQQSELELTKSDLRSEYMVQAREELAQAREEMGSLSPIVKGRSFSLESLTLRSPVRGIVKSIDISTIGGVVPPGGQVMEIIPLDDQLLIEARISPRDVAFIHPGQAASVKITAYDYAIYGRLEGRVSTISPDTIQDEVDPSIYYYRVFVLTSADALANKEGKTFPIVPGMIATVDIHTGSKSVLDYLIKPFNRVREALRER
ncbi:MAG TPA: HlyD family efflux transporter periplasmic adaptor subunit [Alteraurantiacibacter sp.]